MNHDVFISYSSKNPTAAQAICHELEDNGIKCWMAPRDITPGKKYGDLIDDAILTCRVFLLVYSADSLSSQWCNGELNVAFTEGKTIIPYRIDPTPLKGAMRVILNQTHWIDAYPNYKTRFKDLVTVVGQSLVKTIPSTSHTPAPTSQPSPIRVKKYWWVTLCVVVIGVFGWVWSNRESADYPDIEENLTSEIIAGQINSEDSDANAELEELRATQARLEKENNELKHNNEELKNSNKDLQKDIDNIKAKEEAERQAKLQAEKKAKEEAYNIGEDYYYGRKGKSQNYAEAVKWYRKAAEKGDAEAQYSLGFCYHNGQGITQDYTEAVKWYRKAAEQGEARAQNLLGQCYGNGRGVTLDFLEAIKWHRKAAEQGHTQAQYNLAEYYHYGKGVEKDINKAIELYQQAAQQGYEPAQDALTRLARTPNEIN